MLIVEHVIGTRGRCQSLRFRSAAATDHKRGAEDIFGDLDGEMPDSAGTARNINNITPKYPPMKAQASSDETIGRAAPSRKDSDFGFLTVKASRAIAYPPAPPTAQRHRRWNPPERHLVAMTNPLPPRHPTTGFRHVENRLTGGAGVTGFVIADEVVALADSNGDGGWAVAERADTRWRGGLHRQNTEIAVLSMMARPCRFVSSLLAWAFMGGYLGVMLFIFRAVPAESGTPIQIAKNVLGAALVISSGSTSESKAWHRPRVPITSFDY